MWLFVSSADDEQRLLFGRLDSEPLVNLELHWGKKLAVSYDSIRDHMKAAAFNQ